LLCRCRAAVAIIHSCRQCCRSLLDFFVGPVLSRPLSVERERESVCPGSPFCLDGPLLPCRFLASVALVEAAAAGVGKEGQAMGPVGAAMERWVHGVASSGALGGFGPGRCAAEPALLCVVGFLLSGRRSRTGCRPSMGGGGLGGPVDWEQQQGVDYGDRETWRACQSWGGAVVEYFGADWGWVF